MGNPNFSWDVTPLLQIWREKDDGNGGLRALLESYEPMEALDIMANALSSNTVRITIHIVLCILALVSLVGQCCMSHSYLACYPQINTSTISSFTSCVQVMLRVTQASNTVCSIHYVFELSIL